MIVMLIVIFTCVIIVIRICIVLVIVTLIIVRSLIMPRHNRQRGST